ncbi:NYN domain-containing protein [Campylobacter helveticus]|uniref:NYN domain-containing protein n=1 Tax=Campylobacter helveticus TaxID=28898 RepID=UPI00214A133A|nr:NYN domain-containing protein [Campylobacter helveticus]MCR2055260.1 NYN domain-containing protein [Campylobacter helveticus]MCR2062067.1 NYN domain-containing protein [Campylobacter helveticus]
MFSKIAILVDGEFFIKRHLAYFKKLYPNKSYNPTPQEMAKAIQTHCLKHIKKENNEELYRIFFYDCKPLNKKAHYPLSKKSIDFSKTQKYIFRNKLHECLVSIPRLALRFGYLDEHNATWTIKDENKLKQVLSGDIFVSSLKDDDYKYHAKQKGVDIKIGLDIATLTLKKIVERIVLISGDSDFVPAAKLARTEGVIFTLDPMGNPIKPDLKEHIDYLNTTLPNYKNYKA